MHNFHRANKALIVNDWTKSVQGLSESQTNLSAENKPPLYNWKFQKTIKNTESPVDYKMIQFIFTWWFGHIMPSWNCLMTVHFKTCMIMVRITCS